MTSAWNEKRTRVLEEQAACALHQAASPSSLGTMAPLVDALENQLLASKHYGGSLRGALTRHSLLFVVFYMPACSSLLPF
jgi:hypothetical protein